MDSPVVEQVLSLYRQVLSVGAEIGAVLASEHGEEMTPHTLTLIEQYQSLVLQAGVLLPSVTQSTPALMQAVTEASEQHFGLHERMVEMQGSLGRRLEEVRQSQSKVQGVGRVMGENHRKGGQLDFRR